MATFAVTAAGQAITSPWPQAKAERITAAAASDRLQLTIQFNQFLANFAAYLASEAASGSNITTGTPSAGTTVTMATSAQIISIGGVAVSIAAETAKAFGALGTIPASTWGLIAIDRVAAATTTFVSAAANYTTGYATEAAAIAAMPAVTANKARTGYITILASASGWVAGTDALAGNTGGNPATTTNYYGIYGTSDALFWTANQIARQDAVVLTSANY
jgi:hypothetical protein